MDGSQEGNRLALTTQQAAAEVGVSAHAIRYYERIGLVRVPRDERGHRAYDEACLRRLVFLIRMRKSGMTMARLCRYLDLVEQGPDTRPQRLPLLREHRESVCTTLAELQLALDLTDHKIATYGGNLGDESATPEETS